MPTASQFTVRIEHPIDYASSLEMFRRSGDDLLDRWDGEVLVRTITLSGRPIAYACTFEVAGDALELRVTAEDSHARGELERFVQSMFVLPSPNFAGLRARDRVIAALDARYPAVRSVRHANLFVALLRCITAQQVNLRWAATCRRRLAEAFGRMHRVGCHVVYSLDPAQIATLDISDIRALQITNSKSEYIINAARTVAHAGLTIEMLERLSDDEVIARLTAIRGIGVWTAEWVLARSLGRSRVVAGDLGVRKATGIAYFGGGGPPSAGRTDGSMPSAADVRRATAHWGDSAAVAQALMLHALAEKSLAEVVATAGGTSAPPAAAIPIRPKSARNSPSASRRKP
jgi:DNA-3-methyladenine glycosylase II